MSWLEQEMRRRRDEQERQKKEKEHQEQIRHMQQISSYPKPYDPFASYTPDQRRNREQILSRLNWMLSSYNLDDLLSDVRNRVWRGGDILTHARAVSTSGDAAKTLVYKYPNSDIDASVKGHSGSMGVPLYGSSYIYEFTSAEALQVKLSTNSSEGDFRMILRAGTIRGLNPNELQDVGHHLSDDFKVGRPGESLERIKAFIVDDCNYRISHNRLPDQVRRATESKTRENRNKINPKKFFGLF